MKTPLFYRKKPMFGMDIGTQSIKIMQLNHHATHASVQAYGKIQADTVIAKKSIITDVPKTAQLVDDLLSTGMNGNLTTNRVVISIPTAHVFTRVLTVPMMFSKELMAAVKLEVDQAIPVPSKDLYYDYETELDKKGENFEVRIIAAPKAITDSYLELCEMLGLELVLVETNIQADALLCMAYDELEKDRSYILVDIGANTVDIGILDDTLRITGTVEEGGDDLTAAIARVLHLSPEKAQTVKSGSGLNPGPQQAKIKKVVEPTLAKVAAEIKRMMRFYEERQEGFSVSQILIVGGGANMPGISDYLTDILRIPTRLVSPWGKTIQFGRLEPPEYVELPRFLTSAGLALARDDEDMKV